MANLRLLEHLLLAAMLFISIARAVYLMDDTNTTIQYDYRSAWNRSFSDFDFDKTKLYYGGYAGTVCNYEVPRCHMVIPFTGTGITLYAVVAWSFALAINVDGRPPTTHKFDGVNGCCKNGILPIYNFTFFDVQSLPFGDHTLFITFLDVTTGNLAHDAIAPNGTAILFDYAAVNDTHANPIFTPTPALPPAPTATPTPSHVPIGALIGGAIGGVAFLIALFFSVFYTRRRKRMPHVIEIDPEPKIHVSDNSLADMIRGGIGYVSPFGGHAEAPLPVATTTPQTVSNLPPLHVGPTPHSSPRVKGSPLPPPSIPYPSDIGPPAEGITPAPQRPTSSANSSFLTPEDIQFYDNLRSLNLPTAEIASMMEALRAQRGAANNPTTDSSSLDSVCRELDVDPDGAPPAYHPKAD